jgi:ABC-type nitrate/sulfonate/bicarbonate transport system substrate-binding protein
MKRVTVLAALAALAIGALALVPGAVGAKKETTRITVCYANAATDFTPLLAAAREGFGPNEGVEIVPRLALGTVPQLLQNGTCQIGIGSGPELMVLYANGGDVALVGGWQNRFGFKLLVRTDKGINKPADLKGHKIGVSTVGGPPDQSARALLKQLKLTPDKDVDIVYIPAITARLAAISNGSLDAAIFSPPVKQVTASGNVKDILDLSFLRWISLAVWTKRDYAVKNPQVVKGFLRAVVNTNRWIIQPQNKDKVLKYLGEMTGISDPAGLEEAYDYGIIGHLAREPVVDPVALRNSIDYTKEQFGKTVNAADISYLTLLDQVLTYRVSAALKAGKAKGTLSGTLKQNGRFTWSLTTAGLSSPVKSVVLQIGKGKPRLVLCAKCKARASGVAKVPTGLSKAIKAGQVSVSVRTTRRPAGEIRSVVAVTPGQ